MMGYDNPWDPRLAGAMGQQPQPPGPLPPQPAPPGVPGQGPLDPNQAQQATALPSEKSQAFQLARQYKLADALRADAKQQMQGTTAGRLHVAPGWGNALASIAGQAAAKYGVEDPATSAFEKFQGKQGAVGMDILRAKGLLGGGGKKKDNDEDDYASY